MAWLTDEETKAFEAELAGRPLKDLLVSEYAEILKKIGASERLKNQRNLLGIWQQVTVLRQPPSP